MSMETISTASSVPAATSAHGKALSQSVPTGLDERKRPVNILMVDDEPAKLLTYEIILEPLGEQLIRAHSANEALEQLLRNEIAVILVDVCMPEIDGYELAAMIRRHPRFQRVAIILVSAIFVEERDRLKGYVSGAMDYVSVPIVPEILRAKVSVYADLYRKTQALESINRELEQRVAERTAMIEQSTELLRASEQRFRLLVENVPDYSIVMLDPEGMIKSWNTGTERLYGYRSEEVIGRSFINFFQSEDQRSGRAARLFEEARAKGHVRFEAWRVRKNGSRFYADVAITALRDEQGKLLGFSKVLHDLTERKRVETELRRVNTQLEARQKEIEEELQLAARVQQSLTPRNLTWGGIAVEAFYAPVRTIGGDFGLVMPRADELSLMVCDVSGHGISSALVANRIYTEAVALIEQGLGLPATLRHLNRFVMKNLGSANFYFTMAAVRLARSGNKLEFSGAGHPPAIMVQRDQCPRLLESQSTVLGLLEDAVNGNATTELLTQAGDRVVIYTDGFTECFNSRDEMLGIKGFAAIVGESSKFSLPDMRQEIIDRVAAWRGGPPADDLSLVIVEIM